MQIYMITKLRTGLSFNYMSTANVNCGCSGIRYCANCLDSNRVISINFVDESSLFAGLKCCVFSFRDRRAHFVPTLFYNSTLSEIYMEIDANSNHVCTADCISMDGVLIMKDFLSTDEEQNIINKIDKGKWKFSQSGRLKQDYGPQVNFKQKKIKLENFSGLPEYTDTLLFKINELNAEKLNGFIPVDLCNLDYSPNRLSSINMHIDDHWIWGERLISINLLSDSLITLQNLKKNFLVFLPLYRRSLLCLNGDQRFLWEHAIFSHHITERRVVITLREAAREFLEGGEQYEQIGRELIDKSRRRLAE